MQDSEPILAKLRNTLPQQGKVEWIGVRPGKRENMIELDEVEALVGAGLAGDRYAGRSGKREVTLIQHEHIGTVASLLQLNSVHPAQLRRNIVVSGLNLLALKHRRFCIGDARLEMTGQCHPCSRMEETFGDGGYNALRGHGGITARVILSGRIRVGDLVAVLED